MKASTCTDINRRDKLWTGPDIDPEDVVTYYCHGNKGGRQADQVMCGLVLKAAYGFYTNDMLVLGGGRAALSHLKLLAFVERNIFT